MVASDITIQGRIPKKVAGRYTFSFSFLTVTLEIHSVEPSMTPNETQLSVTGFEIEPHSSTLNVTERKSKIATNVVETEEIDVLKLDSDLDFPDGGKKAYSVVLGSFMGLVSVFGVLNSVGAIQAYISENQLKETSSSTISWIFAIYVFMTFASCILCGCYFDRNGCKLMMYLGSVFSVIGIFTLAESRRVYQFVLSFGVLFGTGSGILMTCLISSTATWFKDKRANANSMASIGGSIGGIVFPVMLRKLYSELGFQWAIRILGFIITFCLTVSILLTRENPKVMKYCHKRPQWREVVKVYINHSLDLRYLSDLKFLFCTLGCSFAENGLTIMATYYASYAMKRGIPESTAYTLITIINCCGIAGRISGYISDRYLGRFAVLCISLVIMTVLNLSMWLPFGYDLKVLYGYSAVYGFACASVLSLTPVAVSQICQIKDFGKKYSTMYFITAVMSVPTLPIAGTIIGNGSIKNYNHFIIYCSMLTLAGSICYGLSRWFAIGNRLVKF